jgi:hypothetical protein
MKYEEYIGFVSRKMIKKIIADSHVLGLFTGKQHEVSEKKFHTASSLGSS